MESLIDLIYFVADLSISIDVGGMMMKSVYGFRLNISYASLRSHVISSTQDDNATYSTSPEEKATTV